jgi:hypothetical protein
MALQWLSWGQLALSLSFIGTTLKANWYKCLKVKIRTSYSFVKEFHSLTVIPVNTGQMQGLIAQHTDLIDSFRLDSLR